VKFLPRVYQNVVRIKNPTCCIILYCMLNRQALKYYETHELGACDVFTLPVQAVTIFSLIKRQVSLSTVDRSGGPLKLTDILTG
jgi:hypothetical protein